MAIVKIQVLSDLHFDQHEFLDRPPPEISPDADILVLAGDIVNGGVLVSNQEVFSRWYSSIKIPIIYVLGNHEYDALASTQSAHIVYSTWLGRLNPNTILLEDGSVDVLGITFIGSTLFTKLDPLEELNMRVILNPKRMPKDLTSTWWSNKFQYSKKYLTRTLRGLKSSRRNTTVVVTHFAPSFKSIDERFKGFYSNCYFVNNLDYLLGIYPVKYWVHGHTHAAMSYSIEGTQVVCNPHGYIYLDGRKEECATKFNPQLLLEIST